MSLPLPMFGSHRSRLAEREAIIEANLRSFVEVGRQFMAIRDEGEYRDEGYASFTDYVRVRWPSFLGGRRYADRVIGATKVVEHLRPSGLTLPTSEWQTRPLTALKRPEHQVEAWQRAVETADHAEGITPKHVAAVVADIQAELAAAETSAPDDARMTTDLYFVAAWNALPADERRRIIAEAPIGSETKFNRTNDNVEWARWTWNPVTGCDHGCDYCYARDIANRYYTDLPEGERFAPVFRPRRLHAPRLMRVPRAYDPSDPTTIGEKNVFTGSMTDLFGRWVPQDWIDAVFQEVVRAAEWNFLFLTKFPQRLAEQRWPENAWCGTTVDRQARVATAERSFGGVTAGVKWLSCEPLLERLTFTSLEMFDWVVVGASSKSSQTPEFQPPWEWVEHLIGQARAAGCRVYLKPNLTSRPREYPG